MADPTPAQPKSSGGPLTVIVSVVIILAATAGAVWLLLGPSLVREMSTATDEANLRQLHLAIFQYAAKHEGRFPDHVGRLVGDYVEPSAFVYDGETPARYTAATPAPLPVYRVGDYLFINYSRFATAELASDEHKPVLAIAPRRGDADVRYVLRYGPAVDAVPVDDLPALVAEENARRAQLGAAPLDAALITELERRD